MRRAQGVEDLLAAGGAKVWPVIPQISTPIRLALNTRDPEVRGWTCPHAQHSSLLRAWQLSACAPLAAAPTTTKLSQPRAAHGS